MSSQLHKTKSPGCFRVEKPGLSFALLSEPPSVSGSGAFLSPMCRNGNKIISLAKRYSLPAIYPFQSFVAEGGLMSYGADPVETFIGAATYADRILKGAKPIELPVQLPTRFYLALNLRTALGVSFPPSLLFTADEVIE